MSGFGCVMKPWEAYEADLTIDLEKHHAPKTLLDRLAFYTVKTLRVPTDVFFQVLHLISRCLFCVLFCEFPCFSY